MKTKGLRMRVLSALFISAGISCVGAGMAVAETPEGQRKEEAAHGKIDASATLRKSTEVYKGMIKGTHGQVPASVLVFAAFEVKLGQTGLRFLGGLGRQKTETRQPCEDRYGFAMTAGVLVTPSHGENVIDKIQVWHHGAASMQLGEGCPANAYDNRPACPSKMKQYQGKPGGSDGLREFGRMGSAPVSA